mmetsp:Transcript_57740/g.125579  ORF Transcript_57740/g.125579 Transcript_57740/m.125579 type:complete len:83 (+) Transcript_57740:33-281(+)
MRFFQTLNLVSRSESMVFIDATNISPPDFTVSVPVPVRRRLLATSANAGTSPANSACLAPAPTAAAAPKSRWPPATRWGETG